MLTQDNILALPAGYDLNILVAQQVLGYQYLYYSRYPGEYVRFLVSPSHAATAGSDYEVWQEGISPEAKTVPARHVLSYVTQANDFSNRIEDAWLVVEHLTAAGWGHKHQVYSAAAECPGWQWTFMRPGGGLGAGIAGAEADTAPLAICRAAPLTVLPHGFLPSTPTP